MPIKEYPNQGDAADLKGYALTARKLASRGDVAVAIKLSRKVIEIGFLF